MLEGFVSMAETRTRATAVYIDGYNLYYGRIYGSNFKWLDVVALFRGLLNEQDPNSALTRLRYFSAPALAKYATHGQASMEAQQSYHRALSTLYPEIFTLKLGTHSIDSAGTLLPRYVDRHQYDRTDRVRVWKLEEKMTDVNLALAMYRDAASGQFQQMVVCSNDSDVAPAMEAVRADFPHINLGVVTPRRPPDAGVKSKRVVSTSLAIQADWTRQYIRDEELAASLLPEMVPTRKKPIRRPSHW